MVFGIFKNCGACVCEWVAVVLGLLREQGRPPGEEPLRHQRRAAALEHRVRGDPQEVGVRGIRVVPKRLPQPRPRHRAGLTRGRFHRVRG